MRRLGFVAAALVCIACREPNPAFQRTGEPEEPAPDAATRDGAADRLADLAPSRDPDGGGAPERSPAPPDGGAPERSPGPPDGGAPDLAGDGRAAVFCPADRDLALCVRFEGTARDESPAGHMLSTTGVTYVPGADGQALDHRTTSRVRIPNTTAFDVMRVTFEASIRPRALPSGTARVAVIDYHRQFSLFVYAGGAARCGAAVVGGRVEVRVPGVVAVGTWTSLACTVDDTRLALWVDGVVRGSMPVAGFRPNPAGTAGLTIGTNIPSDDESLDPFDGLIDNVRVWKRALSAPEICAASLRCDR